MELSYYKLYVKSDLYEERMTIRAESLSEASRLARVKFSKKYNIFNNIKIKLDYSDIRNHIDEILTSLYL